MWHFQNICESESLVMKQKSQRLDGTVKEKSYQEAFLICICIEKHEALCQLWVYMDIYICLICYHRSISIHSSHSFSNHKYKDIEKQSNSGKIQTLYANTPLESWWNLKQKNRIHSQNRFWHSFKMFNQNSSD